MTGYLYIHYMGHVARIPVFQVRLKPVCSATEIGQNIETWHEASFFYCTFHRKNNKGTDYTARMYMLVCAFVVRLQQNQIFSRRSPRMQNEF